MVNQAGLPYQRRAQTGVTDRERASELSPLGLFTLFFTDYLLRDIVSETNRYAGQCLSQPPKQGEKHLPWHPLTVPECRTCGNVADDVCCAEGQSTGGLLVEKCSNSHPFLRKDDAVPAFSPDTSLSTLCRQ